MVTDRTRRHILPDRHCSTGVAEARGANSPAETIRIHGAYRTRKKTSSSKHVSASSFAHGDPRWIRSLRSRLPDAGRQCAAAGRLNMTTPRGYGPFACANRHRSDSHAAAGANQTLAEQGRRFVRRQSPSGRHLASAGPYRWHRGHSSMETFQVILESGCLEGFDPAEVRTALAELLGQSEDVAEQLLLGREVVVMSHEGIVASTRYVEALRSIGVASWVVPERIDLDADLAVRLMNAEPEMAVADRCLSRSTVPESTSPQSHLLPSQHGRAASVFGWFVVAGTAFVLAVSAVALLTSSGRVGDGVSTSTSTPVPERQEPAGRPPR